MKTVRLGKTGLSVSRIGFGGIPIQRLTEDEAVKVVQRCLDLGVTFLDTASSRVYSISHYTIRRRSRQEPLSYPVCEFRGKNVPSLQTGLVTDGTMLLISE